MSGEVTYTEYQVPERPPPAAKLSKTLAHIPSMTTHSPTQHKRGGPGLGRAYQEVSMAAATWTRTRVKPKVLAILVTVELSCPLRVPPLASSHLTCQGRGQALLGVHRLSLRIPVFAQVLVFHRWNRCTFHRVSVWHTLAQWTRLTLGCRVPAQYHHGPPVSFGTCRWYTCPTPAEIRLDQVPTGQSGAKRAG